MKNKNNSVIHTHSNSTQIFSGPIPPPEVLAKYEELTSGLADRIITMAEIQSNNRHELEFLVADPSFRLSYQSNPT